MAERIVADVCVVGAGYAGLTTATARATQGSASWYSRRADRVGGRIWTQHLPTARRSIAGRVAGPARRDLRAGERGRRLDVQDVRRRRTSARRRGRTRRYTGLIPKISPPRSAPSRARSSSSIAWPSAFRSTRRGRRSAPRSGTRAPSPGSSSVRGSAPDRPRPVRLGRARSVLRRPERHVVPQPAVPGPRRTAASTRCSRSRAAPRRTWSTAAPDRSRGELPTSSATQSDCTRRCARSRNAPTRRRRSRPSSTVSARHAVVTIPPALVAGDRLRSRPARRPPDAVPPRDRGPGDEDTGRLRRAVLARRRLQRPDVGAGSACEVTLDASPAVRHTRCHCVVHVRRRSPRRSTRSIRPNAGARARPRDGAFGPRAASPPSTSRPRGGTSNGPAAARWRTSRRDPDEVRVLLREPFGRVHWAGTETATTSHGAIDGAVRSGERAAAEILDRS